MTRDVAVSNSKDAEPEEHNLQVIREKDEDFESYLKRKEENI